MVYFETFCSCKYTLVKMFYLILINTFISGNPSPPYNDTSVTH